MSSPAVRSLLEDFVEDLYSHVESHRLEELLQGEAELKGADIGSKPEPWTRKHLIRPLLEAVDLEWEPEIHGKGEGYPDFGITNLDVPVIGEDKAINGIEAAEPEIMDYLNNRAASQGAEYGIATDGIEWVIYRIELGGDYLDYTAVNPMPIDFRNELLRIASDKNYISGSGDDPNRDGAVETFVETFDRDDLNTLLTREAPKRIREQKQAGIEEFYDLYVELLFGEGSGRYDYETTLLDDVDRPDDVSHTDVRRFAIKLVNRLLFVKFLEDRGVLPSEFLRERVENYRQAQAEIDEFGGSLYKTQLEPLFFSLFNTEDRISAHRGGWFDKVPYLNGSLFAPEEHERDYDVDDRMLITVVEDLVEGHELGGGHDGIDPSVLGNVFEMTINHLSSGEAQKEEGAYYTPSDVIRLITRESVDPKMYEILVDVYGSRIAEGSEITEEDARDLVRNYELGEILRGIEQREGYFSDPAAIREAYDRIGELKVIDPACGSGHFLTGVLDEIHRVRMSLLRGLKGVGLTTGDVYRSKKELVLGSIYGVDVNPIAIEIAKLRVWLKMVEEGWEQKYGELPNIDVNIVDGNSLIGLPAKSSGQSVIQAFDVDLSRIRNVRDRYREGEITRRELNDRIEELRPELRGQYLDRLNHYIEHQVTDRVGWDALTDGIDDLYPTIRKITVRRGDGEQLSKRQKQTLEAAGFDVEPRFEKSAKVQAKEVEEVVNPSQYLDELIFDVERKPVPKDLDDLHALMDRDGRLALSYDPFHWPLEFPEAVTSNGNGYDVKFDIVVGNPPYGNVLEPPEKIFTEGYSSGSVNDIIAPFVEREIQILKDGGYLGNILALLIAYQGNASPIREVLRDNLNDARIACFSRRPSQVFAGSQARTGIVTGRKDDETTAEPIETSRFIRFTDENREEVFRDITYESTEGLVLGKKIGSGEDYSLPKIGETEIRRILQKLKDHSNRVIRNRSSRKLADKTDHVVWRSRHPAYFINPCLENLYPDGETPQDFDPLYFETEVERRMAFLLLQSSLFYLYWMVYENERDVNWKSIDSFPFPKEAHLDENEDEILELSEILWDEMSRRFKGGSREMIEKVGVLKSLIDEADDLIGPMFGLTKDEIEYVKRYDEEYRLSEVDEFELVEVDD